MVHCRTLILLVSLIWAAAMAAPGGGRASAQAPTPPHSPAQPAARPASHHTFTRIGISERGDTRLAIDPNAIEAIRQSKDGKFTIALPVDQDQSLQLELERFDVVADAARFVRANRTGTMAMAARPQVVLLRGAIAGEAGSRVFLSFTSRGRVLGSITRAAGAQLHLANDPAGEAWRAIISQGQVSLPEFDEFCKVIATEDDANDSPAQGGIAGHEPPPPPPPPPQPDPARGPRLLTIAIDSDQSYSGLFESDEDALAYMVQVLGAVSDIYMHDLNLRICVRFARIWPDGAEPFDAQNLSGFRTYWLNNEDMTGLNLVHMFSGRRNLSYGGVAYLSNACTGLAFAISGFLNGHFPSPVIGPNHGNWDVVVITHEIGHNLSAPHTHSMNPPVDQCASGVEERGTIMSYCHVRPGGLLNIDMRMHALTQDIIFANNPAGPATCLWHDCNANDVDDAIDIGDGASTDADSNGIPDECEDCDGNGTLDPEELASGAADVDGDGMLDACQADCNANGIPDAWEIAQGLAEDHNGNRVPDSCEPDCDGNGVADFYEIFLGAHQDIDRDGIPDACQDCNGNTIADWIDAQRQFNVFVGQAGSGVREYHRSSGVPIQELAASALAGAYGVTIGSDRQVYVASFNNHKVVRINPDTGEATTFVEPGAGGLQLPTALKFGPDGHLYVTSRGTRAVIKYDGQTGAFMAPFILTGSGGIQAPWDLVFGPLSAGGDLFIANGNDRVLRFNGVTGAFVSIFADETIMNRPRGLAFLPNGDLLTTNRGSNMITRHSSAGEYLGQFNDDFPLAGLWGIAIGPNGNVYVPKVTGEVRVVEYNPANGRYIRSSVRGDSALQGATTLAFMPASPIDKDGDGLPDDCIAPLCPADIDGSGAVNVDDLLLLLGSWGPCNNGGQCQADFNGDGQVNADDLSALLMAWGLCG